MAMNSAISVRPSIASSGLIITLLLILLGILGRPLGLAPSLLCGLRQPLTVALGPALDALGPSHRHGRESNQLGVQRVRIVLGQDLAALRGGNDELVRVRHIRIER